MNNKLHIMLRSPSETLHSGISDIGSFPPDHFSRIPVVGDFIQPKSNPQNYYKVVAVLLRSNGHVVLTVVKP